MQKTLRDILIAHNRTYPHMECADFIKLIYQNEFGCSHLQGDPYEDLLEEFLQIRQEGTDLSPGLKTEEIGNGLCRAYLDTEKAEGGFLRLLSRFCLATARTHKGNAASFTKKLNLLRELSERRLISPEPGVLSRELEAYEAAGQPVLRHSDAYRAVYRPHYRVVKESYISFLPVFEAVEQLRGPAIIAIDGRCGSGKTLLSQLIAEVFDCNVFHMDDFFLPKERQTAERLALPGGNMDFERFREEVLIPLAENREVRYRPFDCGKNELKAELRAPFKALSVVEGSYSQHPLMRDRYQLRIFLTCSPKVQRERILKRGGPLILRQFIRQWIPAEERYFAACFSDGERGLLLDTSEYPCPA